MQNPALEAIFDSNGATYEARIVEAYANEIHEHINQTPHLSVTLKDPNRKWRVSSAVQKSIRRGISHLADRYAQALINGGESSYFWTRIPVIAMEDIGLGDPELCALIMALSRYKKLRNGFNEALLASFIAVKLAEATKSRTFCDLTCSVIFTMNDMQHVAATTKDFKKTLSLINSPFAEEGTAGWYQQLVSRSYMSARLLGNREYERKHGTEYDAPLGLRVEFLKYLATRPEISEVMYYLIFSGCKKGVHGLNEVVWPLVKVLPEDWRDTPLIRTSIPEVRVIAGVPDFSFDQHTLEGKKALSYIAKSNPDLRNFFDSVNCQPSQALGMILFQVESAVLDKRPGHPLLERITELNDAIEAKKVKLSPEEAQELRDLLTSDSVRDNLFEIRQKMVTA